MLDDTNESACSIDRDQSLQKVISSPGEDQVHFVVTSWPSSACHTSNVRPNPNHSIQSKLTPPTSVSTRNETSAREVGLWSCGQGGKRQGCRLCPHLGASGNHCCTVKDVKMFHSGEILQIKEDLCFTTKEVLYILLCTKPGCGKQYGGETGRAVYLRFVEHEYDVKDVYTTKAIGRHFQLPGHYQTLCCTCTNCKVK